MNYSKTTKLNINPLELDNQSPIKINRWMNVESEAFKDMDDNEEFTKTILKMGFESPQFLWLDSKGRIWGKGNEKDKYYPLHLTYGGLNIGFMISRTASN